MKVDTAFLIRRRLEVGLAQSELAKEINVTQTTLNRIERGLSGARMSTLRRLAERLDVPIYDLYAEKLDTIAAGASTAVDAAA
jgi:transcriptional regulator with XRE-family HTH domain